MQCCILVWWHAFLLIFAFGDITPLAWNQPQWENLYNRKQQMLKIWAFFSPREQKLSFTNTSNPQVCFFWFLMHQEIWAHVVATLSSMAQGCWGQRLCEFLVFPSGSQEASAVLNITSTFQGGRRKEQRPAFMNANISKKSRGDFLRFKEGWEGWFVSQSRMPFPPQQQWVSVNKCHGENRF